MKSTTEIVDILYQHLNGSALHDEIKASKGVIYTDNSRTVGSGKEDITIAMLSDLAGSESQEFIANVNIYVPDSTMKTQRIINKSRVRRLSRVAIDTLEEFVASDYRFSLQQQPVFKVDGADEHCINNRLVITYLR